MTIGARWWERYPERLERELQALGAAGLVYEKVPELIDKGVMALRVIVPVDGASEEVIATYPDLYPYFRFDVRAPHLVLAHHQNIFTKSLCLIGRATVKWSPANTLAEFLVDRLPLAMRAARAAPDEAATLEEHQGEPTTNYFPYFAAMCLVDSAWVVPTSCDHGELLLGVIDVSVPLEDKPPALRAIVLEVRGANGEVLCEAAPVLREAYQMSQFRGRWSRWGDPLEGEHETPEAHAKGVWDATQKRDAKAESHQQHRHKDAAANEAAFAVRGLLLNEEVSYRHDGPGWLFVVRVRISPPTEAIIRPKHPPRRTEHFYFARGGRAGIADLTARATELAPIRERRIALVGLGCLGGTSAMEFARAGVRRIRAIDHDIVEPGTVLRWPLGLAMAGRFKGEALIRHLALHYPFTNFEPRGRQLGGVRDPDEPAEEEALDWLLEEADLVYDASAEVGVHWMLAAYARARELSYVRVSATPGAWGGYVLRIRPGLTEGCYWCFQLARDDGLMVPPEDPNGEFIPYGCADPTYVGAGFELGQIALQGVRLAIGTLCNGQPGGFPGPDWDVAVISLRGPTGEFVAPKIETFAVSRRPECPVCGGSP